MPQPAIKPWLGSLPLSHLWIDALTPKTANAGRAAWSCERCGRAFLTGDWVANVFTIDGSRNPEDPDCKRGEYVGTVCAECRRDADQRCAAILQIFDGMNDGHVTVQIAGTTADSPATLAARICRRLRSI